MLYDTERRRAVQPSQAIDRRGQRFGRLTVIRRGDLPTAKGGVRWVVLCDCGNEKTVRASDLSSGRTRSCGCGMRVPIHGDSTNPRSPYKAWTAMIRRCHEPNDQHFHNYGGRGITVCERWRQSYKAFRDDMGSRPEGLSLDRIDNDGPYCKENCRWTDQATQVHNSRHVKLNTEAVKVIRHLGSVPNALMARLHGVDPSVVCRVRSGEAWVGGR